MANVKLVFDNPTAEQLKYLYDAQATLALAGITFDSGSDVGDGKILNREWELGWSLKGARIVEVKPV